MTFVKIIIFRLLLALRGIILSISKILALLFITGFILMISISELQAAPLVGKVMALGLGIIFTLINWLYDYLVFYFEPENIEVTLYHY